MRRCVMALRAANRVSSATSCCKALKSDDVVKPPATPPTPPTLLGVPAAVICCCCCWSCMLLLLLLLFMLLMRTSMPFVDADEGPGAERQLAPPPIRLLPPDWRYCFTFNYNCFFCIDKIQFHWDFNLIHSLISSARGEKVQQNGDNCPINYGFPLKHLAPL